MNRIIIITGTRKGIGKGLSEYYLSKGDCVIGCSRGQSSIEHENYIHYSLDIANEEAVINMIKESAKKFGRIDALLNNAGRASMNHLVLTPYATAREIFDTNFFGTFLLLREASKIMIKQKYGRIVNFSTVSVPIRLEGEALYAASKAAVEEITQIAAKELGQFGITVNAVGPTPMQTDLIKNVPQEKIQRLLNQQAVRRFAELEDVINVIDFFLNENSGLITGQIIYLGGFNG